MRYYRNQQGTVVHHPDCTRVTSKSVPWLWAENRSDAVVAMYMAENGIVPCRLCCPPLLPTRAYLRVVESG